MHPELRSFCLTALLLTAGSVAVGQSPTTPSDAALELIELERVRSVVDEAFELMTREAADGAESLEFMVRAADILENEGPAAVPFLIDELKQELPGTGLFCAYSLGLIGSPEALEALRQASDRAEKLRGRLAKHQKGWACYGLGLAGEVDAVRRINTGRHQVGKYPVHGSTSYLEAIAVRVGQPSVPELLRQLDRYGEEESLEFATRRSYVIRALGLVAAPETAEPLGKLAMDAPLGVHRREAVHALEAIGTEQVVAPLIAALQDGDPRVCKSASAALNQLLPAEALSPVLEALKTEENGIVRGTLYQVVAGLKGPAALELLRPYWPGTDVHDRIGLLKAVAIADPLGGFDIVREAIDDSDFRISIPAVNIVATVDTPEARSLLLKIVGSQHWPLAQTAIELASAEQLEGAGTVIAERLFANELAGNVTEPATRSMIEIMTHALVQLDHVESAELLRQRATKQRDAGLAIDLRAAADLLDLIVAAGDAPVEPWLAVADSEDPARRMLAYRKLAEAGSLEALQALCRRFGRVGPKDGLEILRLLGTQDSEAGRELLTRVLIAPEFDSYRTLGLRDMAAWSTRRLGGAEAEAALLASIERRDGRDARVMVYYAVLAGERALPVYASFRAPRLRYLGAYRGREMHSLDRLVRRIADGDSIDAFDVEPSRLVFH